MKQIKNIQEVERWSHGEGQKEKFQYFQKKLKQEAL